MEGNDIGGVGEGTEEALFAVIGVGEDPEGLIGMGGDNDAVKAVMAAVGVGEADVLPGALDRPDGAVGVEPLAERGEEFIAVLAGAAGDGAPLMLGSNAK